MFVIAMRLASIDCSPSAIDLQESVPAVQLSRIHQDRILRPDPCQNATQNVMDFKGNILIFSLQRSIYRLKLCLIPS